MSMRSSFVVAGLILGFAASLSAAEKAKPVRMGCGLMTFDTVPGWGLRRTASRPSGRPTAASSSTRTGNIYVSANKGVVVFSPDGKVIQPHHRRRILEHPRHEDPRRRRTASSSTAPATTTPRESSSTPKTGEIVLKLPFPEESGLKLEEVQPDGDHRRSERRHLPLRRLRQQSHLQVRQDRQVPEALRRRKGNDLKQFNTGHGMTLDTRYDPPRLLICDRNHDAQGPAAALRPRRQLHRRSRHRPGHADLGRRPGRLRLRARPARPAGHSRQEQHDHRRPRPQPRPGEAGGTSTSRKTSGSKGSSAARTAPYWDKDGNLYVQDWNVAGRIMKLVRVKDLSK